MDCSTAVAGTNAQGLHPGRAVRKICDRGRTTAGCGAVCGIQVSSDLVMSVLRRSVVARRWGELLRY